MPTKKTGASTRATKKKVEPEVTVTYKKSSPKDWLVPGLVGAIVVAAFAVGYLYGKVSVYEKLDLKATGTGSGTDTAQAQQQAQPQVSLDQVKELFNDKSNIVFGDAKKKVLFVEFSDPSCPYCHIAAGKNPELNKEVGERFMLTSDGGTYQAPVVEMKKLVDEGKAGFVWLYSPGHGNGEMATQALYCAEEKGKFWEVHDLLMSNAGYDLLNNTVKNDVSNASVLADFTKSAIDASFMRDCLESGKYADRVSSDTALSRQFGVQGTPSFFINEQNFGGAYNYTDMQAVVDAALE